MRNLWFLSFFVFTINVSQGQTIYPPDNLSNDDVDVPPVKAAGYSFIGLGVTAIGYTASNIGPVKNPALIYSIGGAFVATGIAFLIWGTNEGTPKYWKGMKGYIPWDRRINGLFILPTEQDEVSKKQGKQINLYANKIIDCKN